jgi:BirA family biotin operon repressor/biotin-[acetyl-CoA-carboxylase] ligase
MKFKWLIHSFSSVSSTNDVAKSQAQSGAAEGTIILADQQTKGRGTKGRSWYSAKSKGLYATVILRPQRPEISLLPIVAGLAARDSMREAAGLEVGLKWPNDVVWNGKKMGGVLCESSFSGSKMEYVIMGIGMNISHTEKEFPPDIRRLATSLKLASGKIVSPEFLLDCFCHALEKWYGLFCTGKKIEIIRAFEAPRFFREARKSL